MCFGLIGGFDIWFGVCDVWVGFVGWFWVGWMWVLFVGCLGCLCLVSGFCFFGIGMVCLLSLLVVIVLLHCLVV